MKLALELNNKTRKPVSRDFLVKVAKKTIQESAWKSLARKKIYMSVAIIPEKEMKQLNRSYRKINKVTDVLSFAEHKSQAQLKKEKNKKVCLGEIVICFQEIARYAKSKKIPIKEELARVTSHAILHLLGFKHGKKMFAVQESITAGVLKS